MSNKSRAFKAHHQDGLSFGFIGGGKWGFTNGEFTLIYPVNGFETAQKIANILVPNLEKNGGKVIDNFARINISKVTAAN